jgi:hypothetical protein
MKIKCGELENSIIIIIIIIIILNHWRLSFSF